MPLSEDIQAKVRETFHNQNLMNTIGAKLVAFNEGAVTLVAPIAEGFRQHHGFAHAALTFALGDTAAGFAASTALKAPGGVVTSEMKINLLAPAMGDQLRAKGKTIRVGKRQIVVQADIYAETQGETLRHVAVMMGTMVPLNPKTE